MNSKQQIIGLSSSSCIRYLFYFYAFVIFPTFIGISDSYGGNETDYRALLEIKSMITQDPYRVLTSWNDSVHLCDWTGVTCGKRHKRVTSLSLRSQGLEGSLSPHVGNLSFLRTLSLLNNSFQGAIPHEIGRLSRLRNLTLRYNKFNGVIPANISGCSNYLEQLDLSYNELIGSIPKEMSLFSKLAYILLDGNNLTGGIPPFLGNITSVKGFSAFRNPFGGHIPDSLGNWKALEYIYFDVCNLSGTIPHSLYNLSLLTDISLSVNQLTGSLPLAIGNMLPNLAIFRLWDNILTGPLPTSISNCSRLGDFEMSHNKFSGKLRINFAKLADISRIILGDNLFESENDDEMKFIDSMKNCSKLEKLNLYNCNFQGVLPRSIGNLSTQLRILSLGENQLHGNLPKSIGNLVGLTGLYLGGNEFTGNIPLTIGKIQKLQEFEANENQLSGQIPDVMGNLSSLIRLYLFSNMLEWIPSSLGNCHNLIEVVLSDNNFNGNIPSQILQLSSLSKVLDLSRNRFFGSLPTEVGNLKMLSYLDISDNNLSGNIPSSLGDCASLSSLSLKGNLFQGMIPASLSSLKGLVELDISQNNLSGEIPQFLERFPLKYMNLSYNDFEGEVPTLGVFANASAFSVWKNNRLCGGIVELGLPKCKDTKKQKTKFPFFVIIILIAAIVFTIICLACCLCKKKSNRWTSQSSSSKRFLKVSYNQLLKATNGFSESNLIGNGGFSSVYKGLINEDDDRFVAVKVLHLRNRGAQNSFIRECEAWQNIRHRNLVKIITSCSSVDFQGNDFKALVYEFMSNGSLHDWLHSSESRPRLNFLQMIKILIDVASALDYIHNHCVPTFVHGDLKPSNILLDDDMVAHIGDFGLARFLGTTSYQNSSTGIRGTIGYAPPEYGLGSEMAISGDVYSFGILLLEVIIGKKPTDDIFNEGLSLHKFASMALPDHVIDVIDVNILNIYQEKEVFMQNEEENATKIKECLVSTITIGVSCSVDSPSQRIHIKQVLQELHQILNALQNI